MDDTYGYEFVGKMPLIQHHDNIEGQDDIKEWILSKEGKAHSVKGDDRSPPWTWMTYLYHTGGLVVVPGENLMSALLFAGSKTTILGKKTGNYRVLSQTGLILQEETMPLLVKGKPVAMADVDKLRGLKFAEQAARVKDLGFRLFVKRVPVGDSKHIRVRPVFDHWTIQGKIKIVNPAINAEALKLILTNAGDMAGLGDWRPGVDWKHRPGPYGRFVVKLKKL